MVIKRVGMNKRGQFFILSAVIIASILVSLVSVRNSVTTGDAPKRFYYYSQQLDKESGAIVDYALYNDPTRAEGDIGKELTSFLEKAIAKTIESQPDMEIFSCVTEVGRRDYLICKNQGRENISVKSDVMDYFIILYGSNSDYVKNWVCPSINPFTGICTISAPITETPINIRGANYLNVSLENNVFYTVPVRDINIQREQFYFLFKIKGTSGNYVSGNIAS